MAGSPLQPVFFYDLGSPECYLAAEQVLTGLPLVPEWEPVLAAELVPGGLTAPDEAQRRDLERRVLAAGLQSVRWPPDLAADTRRAMLAATYAKRVGRSVAFSLAAFRQAFAGGRDLGDETTVLIAGAACEMHPTALLKSMELRSVADALAQANARARAAGVDALPAIVVGDRVFSGSDAVRAAAHSAAAPTRPTQTNAARAALPEPPYPLGDSTASSDEPAHLPLWTTPARR